MLLGTFGASLFGNLLTVKGIVRAGSFVLCFAKWKRKRNCKSWFREKMGFLMLPHPLTSFEIQKYDKNEQRFNGVF